MVSVIKKVKLKNFQCWEELNLEFTEGLNFITGSSDKGKTAIIRAIKWAFLNKPNGDYFRKWDTKETIVEVDSVKRLKTASKNEYYLDDMCFKAFGNNPPQEVVDYANINETNLQEQQDAPFLLSNSAGEVARYLNQTVDLDIIDTTLSNINKQYMKANTDFKYEQESLYSLLEELSKYRGLKQIERKLKYVKRIEKQQVELETKQRGLSNTLNNYREISTTKYKTLPVIEQNFEYLELDCNEYNKMKQLHSNLLYVLQALDNILPQVIDTDKIDCIFDKITELKDMVNKQDIIYNQQDSLESLLQIIENTNKQSISIKVIDDISRVIVDYISLEKKENTFITKMDSLIELLNLLEDYKDSIKENKNNINQLQKDLPKVCPLCSNKLTIGE